MYNNSNQATIYLGGAAGSNNYVNLQGGNFGIGTSSVNSKLTIYEGDIRLYKNHLIDNTPTWLSHINFTDEVRQGRDPMSIGPGDCGCGGSTDGWNLLLENSR